MKIAEYLRSDETSPFSDWFDALDPGWAANVFTALVRIRNGNTSNVKSVGKGVLEWKIDSGPGYRIYFGRDGDEVVILLWGGTKRRQQNDIQTAIEYWLDYKKRRSAKWH
jgi:putative addiction module killer protein